MRNPSDEEREAICAWLCAVSRLDPNKIPQDALTIRRCGDGSVAVEWWEVKSISWLSDDTALYSGPYRITVGGEAMPPPFEMADGQIIESKVATV